jgi:matrix metalloproteinase-14 (membrane-inserted)
MSKLYFFRGDRYIRYDAKNDKRDPGYHPAPRISAEWDGLPASGVDAALNWGNGKTYFFAGDQCYQFDSYHDSVDEGYPRDIVKRFKGLTLDAVDACIKWDLKTAYFFRGRQYWAYDLVNDTTYANYPRQINGNWPPINHPNILKKLSDFGFDSNLDAALNWGNGKAYFFKGSSYVRYNMDSNREGVEAGWPKDISAEWEGLFPNGVRSPVMLGYAGFDRSEYPGQNKMMKLWSDTNLIWCGFYLAPAPSRKDESWMTELAAIRDIGWAAAPIYFGQSQPGVQGGAQHPSAARGVIDAQEAADLATTAGFEPGTIIYLDVDFSPTKATLVPKMRDYYVSWVATITTQGFRPGVYCPFQYAETLLELNRTPAFWIVNGKKFPMGPTRTYKTPFPAPEPLLTTIPEAASWQLALDVKAKLGTQTILKWDCDSSSYLDPSSIP